MEIYEILGKFEIFKYIVQASLCDWLTKNLTKLDADWWQNCVLNSFSPDKLRYINNRIEKKNLDGFDFLELLQILNRNFSRFDFTNQDRIIMDWVRDLRNRWSHKNTKEIKKHKDTFGVNLKMLDLDKKMLSLLLDALNAPEETLKKVQTLLSNPVVTNKKPISPSSYGGGIKKEIDKKQLQVAYAMSRFDYHIINDITKNNYNQTKIFEFLAHKLKVKSNTLKNYRDSFDPYVKQENSNRKGWWQKKLTHEFKAIKENYDNKTENDIKKELEKILK